MTFEIGVCQVPLSDPLGELGPNSPSPSTLLPAMSYLPGPVSGKGSISLRHPGLASYPMTQSFTGVKYCSCPALFNMQISLGRATLHIFITLVGTDLSEQLPGGWKALGLEGWTEGQSGRHWEGTWKIFLHTLPFLCRSPREKGGATPLTQGAEAPSHPEGEDTFLAAPHSKPRPGARSAQHPHSLPWVYLFIYCATVLCHLCSRPWEKISALMERKS